MKPNRDSRNANASTRFARRRMPMLMVIVAIAATFATPTLLAAPGDLDTTFGGGIVEFSVGSVGDEANGVSVLPDGRVLAAGSARSSSTISQDSSWVLMQRTVAGAADPSFGGGSGKAFFKVGGNFGTSGKPDGALYGLLAKNNGTIIAGGCALDSTGSYFNTYVAQWHADGTLDSSFGSGGLAFASFGKGSCAGGLLMEADEKLIAVGYLTDANGDADLPAILRFDTSGALDPTFGVGGVFQVPSSIPASQVGSVYGITIQPDNKFVVSMCNFSSGITNPVSVLIRLSSLGKLDTTFGTKGVATTGIKACVGGLTIQPDGKIVAAFSSPDQPNNGVVRFTSQGALDTSFNGQGWVLVPKMGGGALALLPTGQILLAGSAYPTPNKDLIVARVTAAGVLDSSFTGGTQSGSHRNRESRGVQAMGRTSKQSGCRQRRYIHDSGQQWRNCAQKSLTRSCSPASRAIPCSCNPPGFAFRQQRHRRAGFHGAGPAMRSKMQGLTSGAYVPVVSGGGAASTASTA